MDDIKYIKDNFQFVPSSLNEVDKLMYLLDSKEQRVEYSPKIMVQNFSSDNDVNLFNVIFGINKETGKDYQNIDVLNFIVDNFSHESIFKLKEDNKDLDYINYFMSLENLSEKNNLDKINLLNKMLKTENGLFEQSFFNISSLLAMSLDNSNLPLLDLSVLNKSVKEDLVKLTNLLIDYSEVGHSLLFNSIGKPNFTAFNINYNNKMSIDEKEKANKDFQEMFIFLTQLNKYNKVSEFSTQLMLKVFNNGDLNENENGQLIAASIRLLTTTIVTPRVLLKNANRNIEQIEKNYGYNSIEYINAKNILKNISNKYKLDSLHFYNQQFKEELERENNINKKLDIKKHGYNPKSYSYSFK